MRIAVLGAGLAGLATTWYLLWYTQGSATVDLYDPLPIGSGVSGISSGLLHAFAGKHAKKSAFASEKIDAVHTLLKEASRGAARPIVLSHGILRPTTTLSQVEDFKKSASLHADECDWWEKEKCETQVMGLKIPEKSGGGLFIKRGLTLDMPTYLEGLWQACALMGTQYHQTAIIKENELKRYDRVVFALGHAMKKFAPLADLPIETIKGQVVTLKWPTTLPPLPFSLISEGYLVMGKGGKECLAGATFERTFESTAADLKVALPLIRAKISPFFPALDEAEVLNCQAGIRAASMKDHLPLLGKFGEKFWFITGLGSKGVIYHGWLGDHLAQALLKDDPSLIPKPVSYPR